MALIRRNFKENKRTDRKKSMLIIAQYDARESVFVFKWKK